MNRSLIMTAILSAAFPYEPASKNTSCVGGRLILPNELDGKKCSLPDCNKLTKHNGGYCSAEHCKLHRIKLKGKE